MKMLFSLLILLTSLQSWANCTDRTSIFKDNEFSVETLSYSPAKVRSIVLIIPPTGGTNMIDRSYAKGLCKEGIATYILSHWTDDDEYTLELSIHTRFYARAYRAIGVLIKNIPQDKPIGLLGTSVGGIHGAIAASRYPEITSAFIITGGAHIPSIIANSDQDVMVKAWEGRKEIYNLKTKSEYIAKLENVIELEPLNRLAISTPKKFGMVISKADSTVPFINQERLRTLWKPEKVIYKDYDHFWSIVSTWLFNASEIYDFFKGIE